MNQHNVQNSVLLLILTGVSGLLSGCGESKKPWETAIPAAGIIQYDGKPLAGAMISLIPENSDIPVSVRPSATSKPDGTFSLGTYSSGDGAPEGTYKVIVTHYPVIGPPENPSAGPNDLPSKYAKADTTDLKLTVTPPSTTFEPLALKSATGR